MKPMCDYVDPFFIHYDTNTGPGASATGPGASAEAHQLDNARLRVLSSGIETRANNVCRLWHPSSFWIVLARTVGFEGEVEEYEI